MMPMFSTVGSASSRLMSCSTIAKSTPTTAVIRRWPWSTAEPPGTVPTRSKTVIDHAVERDLGHYRLIKAETWLGAAGWASGNQACSGTMPAFDPVPRKANTSASNAAWGVSCAMRMLSKS